MKINFSASIICFVVIASFAVLQKKGQCEGTLMIRATNTSTKSENSDKNITVFPVLDILRVSTDFQDNVPDWVEVDKRGDCGVMRNQFISPLNSIGQDVVKSNYVQHLQLSTTPVIIKLALPQRMLGYSGPSRVDSVRDIGVDPLYIDSYNPENQSTSLWFDWRLEKSTGLLSSLSKISRDKGRPVVVTVAADWTNLDSRSRALTCEDWPEWAKMSLIDEVILESYWENPENKQLLAQAREALSGTKVKMTVALDLQRNGKAVDPLGQLLNLQGEKVDGIVVKVENEVDLPRAKQFVTEVLPEFAFGLRLQDNTLAISKPNNATP